MKKAIAPFLLFAIGFWSCNQNPKPAEQEPQAPLFDYLGSYEWKVTTNSEMAQKFFTQGLMLAYGFNHEEAIRSFTEAIRLDPECAMCYWGLAFSLGPNINAPMDTGAVKPAYEAAQTALEKSPSTTEWEKELIKALSVRFIDSIVEDRHFLDSAYVDAMRNMYHQFPENDDIAGLFADAIMNAHSWDYWQYDKSPQPWTPELLQTLETLLARNPAHIAGAHLYIHAVEASNYPEKALPYADTLVNLVPGAGHLVHMPSHTYIRTGHYHKGTLVNQQAQLSDSLYITHCKIQGFYPVTYYPHNIHFIAACAMLEGRSELAIEAAFNTANHADHELINTPLGGTVQHFTAIPFYVLVKFAKWDHILELPAPSDAMKYTIAIWHYARGMAYSGKGDLEKATKELAELETLSADTTLQQVRIWGNNPSSQLVMIAVSVLKAEVDWRKGKMESTIAWLRKSVAIEDSLIYQEPPDWFFSVRHSLGSALLDAGKYAEAEKIYLEDLKNFPENGWALHGLYESLLKQNKTEEVQTVKARFAKMWEYGDIQLKGSVVTNQRI